MIKEVTTSKRSWKIAYKCLDLVWYDMQRLDVNGHKSRSEACRPLSWVLWCFLSQVQPCCSNTNPQRFNSERGKLLPEVFQGKNKIHTQCKKHDMHSTQTHISSIFVRTWNASPSPQPLQLKLNLSLALPKPKTNSYPCKRPLWGPAKNSWLCRLNAYSGPHFAACRITHTHMQTKAMIVQLCVNLPYMQIWTMCLLFIERNVCVCACVCVYYLALSIGHPGNSSEYPHPPSLFGSPPSTSTKCPGNCVPPLGPLSLSVGST